MTSIIPPPSPPPDKSPARPSALSALFSALFCSCMAAAAIWVAFADVRITGGIRFLPAEWNRVLGRFAFGFGGCVMALMAWAYFRMCLRLIRTK